MPYHIFIPRAPSTVVGNKNWLSDPALEELSWHITPLKLQSHVLILPGGFTEANWELVELSIDSGGEALNSRDIKIKGN